MRYIGTKYITLTKENIDTEHICCAFSDKKCIEGYEMKNRPESGCFGAKRHKNKKSETQHAFQNSK